MCKTARMRIYVLLCALISQTLGQGCDFDSSVDGLLLKNTALQGHTFWRAKSNDVIECARICVKRKQCLSFNFDFGTRRCELNDAIYSDGKTLKPGANSVYSTISDWPSQLEPNCFAKPCGNDEVCIPGPLTGGPDCSYSCFNLKNYSPSSRTTSSTNSSTTLPTDRCQGNWKKFGDSCYLFSDYALNWTDALAECRNENASLIEIDDDNENDFIKTLGGNGNTPVWIGLNDIENEGDFRWIGSNNTNVFSAMRNNRPNDKESKDCFTSEPSGWSELECHLYHQFICEK